MRPGLSGVHPITCDDASFTACEELPWCSVSSIQRTNESEHQQTAGKAINGFFNRLIGEPGMFDGVQGAPGYGRRRCADRKYNVAGEVHSALVEYPRDL